MGANRKSYGLDFNILICCVIVFGDCSSSNEMQSDVGAPAAMQIVDDLGQGAPKHKKQKTTEMTPLQKVSTPLHMTQPACHILAHTLHCSGTQDCVRQERLKGGEHIRRVDRLRAAL